MKSDDSSAEDPCEKVKQLPKALLDINNDCLTEICKYLDLAAQYSLLQTCKKLFDLIVHGLWAAYHKNGFDMKADQSINTKSNAYQANFLYMILKNFSVVYNINVDIFVCCVSPVKTLWLPNVTSLGIENIEPRCKSKKRLQMRYFYAFPNLLHLELRRISLSLIDKIYPYCRVAFIRDVLKSCDILESYLKFGMENDESTIIILSYNEAGPPRAAPRRKQHLHLRQVTFNYDYAQYKETWLEFTKPHGDWLTANDEFCTELMQAYYREVLESTNERPVNVAALAKKFFVQPLITYWHTDEIWNERTLLHVNLTKKFFQVLIGYQNKNYKRMLLEHFKHFMRKVRRLKMHTHPKRISL